MADDGQHEVALRLHRRQVQATDVVALGVVSGLAADDVEVCTAKTGRGEDVQVVVAFGSQATHVGRLGDDVWADFGQFANKRRVIGCSPQQRCWTTGSISVEIEHYSDITCPRVLLHEGHGAVQTRLLTVVEEKDHITGQAGARPHGAHRFEHRRHRHAVIAGTRAGLDRVIMRSHQDSWCATGGAG